MYKVGTRVKKVWGKRNLGLTGIVVPWPKDLKGLPGDTIAIRPDQGWVGRRGVLYPAGHVGGANPKDWEPIVPEGAAEGSWDKCVWKPEKVEV